MANEPRLYEQLLAVVAPAVRRRLPVDATRWLDGVSAGDLVVLPWSVNVERLLGWLELPWRAHTGGPLAGAVTFLCSGTYEKPEELRRYLAEGGQLVDGALTAQYVNQALPGQMNRVPSGRRQLSKASLPATSGLWPKLTARWLFHGGDEVITPTSAAAGTVEAWVGKRTLLTSIGHGEGRAWLFASRLVPLGAMTVPGAVVKVAGALAELGLEARGEVPARAPRQLIEIAVTTCAWFADVISRALHRAVAVRCSRAAATQARTTVAPGKLEILWHHDAGAGAIHFLGRVTDGHHVLLTRQRQRWAWLEGERDMLLASVPDEHFATAAAALRPPGGA